MATTAAQPTENRLTDKPLRDFRQEVTDNIVQMLERGVAPWQKPWEPGASSLGIPFNPTSERAYCGGNAIHLMATSLERGYDDPRWMTYKQAADNGWQIRRGEKGTQIEYWEVKHASDKTQASGPGGGDGSTAGGDNADAQRSRFIHRVYTVFNAQQVERIPPHTPKQHTAFEAVQAGEQILNNSGANIAHDQADRAFYSRSQDSIHLPPKDAFKDAAGYYGTALHELAHNADLRIMPRGNGGAQWVLVYDDKNVGITARASDVWIWTLHSVTEEQSMTSNPQHSQTTNIGASLRPHRDAFSKQLSTSGYSLAVVRLYERMADRFCHAVAERGLRTKNLHGTAVEELQEAALHAAPKCHRIHAKFCLGKFLQHLVEAGVATLPEPPIKKATAMDLLREEYSSYLHHQRGLSEHTIYHCLRFFARFMTFRFGTKLGNLNAITTGDIVAFLEQLRAGTRPSRDKTPPTHLRTLFKFLFWSGKTRSDLGKSIPRVAQPQPTNLPRYLKPEAVQQLLDATRAENPIGRRDYAMLMLMARLGLRAPEVIAIQLEDIDWRAGEILIRGKGKRQDRMPLPDEVGQAVVDYIQHGRTGASRALFVIARAPYRPFPDAQILNIVLRKAFARTGLKPPQKYVGSHVLRHSLATDMLGKGASLDEIGDVLRHRSRVTTTIYAKLDIDALRSVARAWPQGEGR